MEIKTTEHHEQVRFFEKAELYENQIPELKNLYANPNGGKRHIGTAVKLKREGVKSGVPDIFLAWPIHPYHGLYIELKIGKNKPTTNQNDWIDRLNNAGYLAVVAYGCDEAWGVMMKYLGGNIYENPELLKEQPVCGDPSCDDDCGLHHI